MAAVPLPSVGPYVYGPDLGQVRILDVAYQFEPSFRQVGRSPFCEQTNWRKSCESVGFLQISRF